MTRGWWNDISGTVRNFALPVRDDTEWPGGHLQQFHILDMDKEFYQ